MTSTTETLTAGVDQPQNNQSQSLPNQEPVSPVSENETTAEQQTEQTDQSNAETASPKKEATIKPTIHKLDYEKDVVYLYQFSRCPTIPSASPFCLKVENWLRMNGIQYEVLVIEWFNFYCVGFLTFIYFQIATHLSITSDS